MLSDEWLPRYRLLENFTAKWNGNGNGNGNAYDRGDYNSSFALRAVELKINGIRRITDKNFEELSADRPREANCKRILQIILLEHCQGLLVQKP